MKNPACVVFILSCVHIGSTNYFDPHVFPSRGPFFEGWYLRIFDYDTSDSMGCLFGHVLPGSDAISNKTLVLGSILVRTNCEHSICVLKSYNAGFKPWEVTITRNGKPITTNPNASSPSLFRWSMTSSSRDHFGEFINNESSTVINFVFGNVTFLARFGPPVPWGPHGEGPEGWIADLPFFPLYWFVYSLRSPLEYYEFIDRKQGIYKSGTRGSAHMEKNWGDSFPGAWIWSQGVSGISNISYAISGGPIRLGPLPAVTAFLLGYRNPNKNITLNFTPINSVVQFAHDACHGTVNITAIGDDYKMHMILTAGMGTFSDCLYGPEKAGFQRACVESYDARADIFVLKGVFKSSLIDKQIIMFSALEFGGDYVCEKRCK